MGRQWLREESMLKMILYIFHFGLNASPSRYIKINGKSSIDNWVPHPALPSQQAKWGIIVDSSL